MEIQTKTKLDAALECLEKTDFTHARALIDESFSYDFHSKELIFASDCCNFWLPYIAKLSSMETSFEKGESLIAAWKNFRSFIERKTFVYKPALLATEIGIFSFALEQYKTLFDERDAIQKAHIFRKAGLCCKKLGRFEDAKQCLRIANEASPQTSEILCEFADCYALCGDERSAKVLFREAFFINPETIDLDFLDSALITTLIQSVREKGFTGKVLLEWLPVYARLWQVFNITRPLQPQQLGKLKQEIYAVENELKDPASDAKLLNPRLINLYLHLIDNYVVQGNAQKFIDDIRLKIKILDSAIFDLL